jgi:predicted transcriptional regulator
MANYRNVRCSQCKIEVLAAWLRHAAALSHGFSCECGHSISPTQVADVVAKLDAAAIRAMSQKPDPKTLARTSDPSTSKQAAKEILANLPEARQHALDAVRQYPGFTSNELAQKAGDGDPRKINRRLAELERVGLVQRDPPRVCSISGRRAAIWYPT